MQHDLGIFYGAVGGIIGVQQVQVGSKHPLR